MKKLAYMFLLVGSLLLGTNVVNADGAKKKSRTKFVSCADQTCQIKALIGSPDIFLDRSSKVEVKFSINEYNVITVNEVNAENAELRNFVYNKMNGSRINGNEVEVKDQSLKLLFKPEVEEIFLVY